jgi:DNA-binding transcriptional MerR regulator
MATMKIGELAKRSHIGIETIRYYEREGLLLAPQRRPSGYRQYDESTVERLEYIRRAKGLGFTLAEIRELLELSFVASAGCDHIRQRAEAKVADIDEKVRSLQLMKRSLGKIVQQCRTKNSTDDCPLVHKSKKQPV